MPRKRAISMQPAKDAQALELRKAGANYDAIARQLGYANRSGAYKAVMRSLNAALQQRNKTAEDVIELELQRLDDMLLGLWKDARSGRWLAVDRVLHIMERRSAYLGLDAPKKTEMSGPEGGPIHVEQDVTYSIEERRRRVLALVAQFGSTRPGGIDALPGPDLDSAGGSTDERLDLPG